MATIIIARKKKVQSLTNSKITQGMKIRESRREMRYFEGTYCKKLNNPSAYEKRSYEEFKQKQKKELDELLNKKN